MSDLVLSSDQQSSLDDIMSWTKTSSRLLTMGGFAGTGKTTLIAELRRLLPKNACVAFCCFTGKATSVLLSKLKAAKCLKSRDSCSTIHSLIYDPVIDKRTGKVKGWKLKDNMPYNFIIMDEASMVNEELFADLSSYGIPILGVGDHGQLPPVSGSLNLMADPDIKLEKIHRQAEGNPIIKVSMAARLDGHIPYGSLGGSVAKVAHKHDLIYDFLKHSKGFKNTILLCGFNSTRVDINKKLRAMMSRTSKDPQPGDRVVCLRNNKESVECPIYNGILGTVIAAGKLHTHYEAEVDIDGEEDRYFGPISFTGFNNDKPDFEEKPVMRLVPDPNDSSALVKKKQRLDIFDFGYCLSVHKSQGSEWNRVMLFEQPCRYWSGPDWNRWLYTAVTRAKEQLLIVR